MPDVLQDRSSIECDSRRTDPASGTATSCSTQVRHDPRRYLTFVRFQPKPPRPLARIMWEPDLLLDPVPNIVKTPARVTYAEVVGPAAQDRIDPVDDQSDRLGFVMAEHFAELPEKLRPRRHTWHV